MSTFATALTPDSVIAGALGKVNDFLRVMGKPLLNQLPAGKRRDSTDCVLARVFNDQTLITKDGEKHPSAAVGGSNIYFAVKTDAEAAAEAWGTSFYETDISTVGVGKKLWKNDYERASVLYNVTAPQEFSTFVTWFDDYKLNESKAGARLYA